MHNARPNRRVFTMVPVLAAVVLVGGAALVAQSGRSLSGIVRDVMGRPLAGIEVQLTTASGNVLKATTSAEGVYEFPGLGPGSYDFRVSRSGFRTERAALFFDGRSSVRRDVKLGVGSISQELTVTPGASAAPPAARPDTSGDSPAPCAPKADGGDIREPRKIVDARPIYPLDLAAAGTSGRVVMAAIISKQGTVGHIRQLLEVEEAFAAATTAAVTQWRFTPTLLNCAPIEVEMTVTVNFTLGK